MAELGTGPYFVSLGLFIIDEFSFADENGQPTGITVPPQIGGGGTYAAIGSRIWLPPQSLGMIIDRGNDFPPSIQAKLSSYGTEMWFFRDHMDRGTTRALNSYSGNHRGFQYLTPRIRLSPSDLETTRLAQPKAIHFICSPKRALGITSEVRALDHWHPTTIYEPIPDRCVPEEMPSLVEVLPSISVLSPNAEEALSLLSMTTGVTKTAVEEAARRFLDLGVGEAGKGCVIIRSGSLGAFVITRETAGIWVDAFWTSEDASKVVDVTGAGNSFLGGFAAGLLLANGDLYEAAFYATVSASFTIEQEGLPGLSKSTQGNVIAEEWNGDSPSRRLGELLKRHGRVIE